MDAQYSQTSDPQQWTPEARKFVQDRQEREYRRLAQALGLGSDPAKAYARLSRHPMPFDHVSPQKFRQEIGVEFHITPEEWLHFDTKVADLHKHYLSLEPPTLYEDPNRYSVMVMIFDALQEELSRGVQSPLTKSLLATLPSGDVNATIVVEPETGASIIFFEHGLFQFFYDFALLVGWAVPPLSPQQLSDDVALAGLLRAYTMPPQASQFFAGSLYGYIVEGTPLANPSPLPRPTHNMVTTILILTLMERFVMAHELAHIKTGHLDKSPEKEHEYEADAAGLALVSENAYKTLGSWAVGFWACDLALTALNFLYRASGLFAFGPQKLAWISKTHPDPLSRRSHLRERAARIIPNVPQVSLAAVGELCGMTDAVFQRLWEISLPMLLYSYQNGARPSPLWNDGIKYNFTTRS